MQKEHKTFCVEGAYNHIRNAMKKRGWLEKSEQVWPSKRLKENTSGLQSPKDKNPALISRMLRNIQVDFLWTSRAYSSHWYDFRRRQIVSRFPRTGFNTKVGLCSSLQQQHWYYEEGVSNTLFPRCYNIYNTEELEAFKDDFHMTASISLLKWLVDNYENKKDKAVSSTDGKIPVAAVEFAISRCDEYVSVQTHGDIDREVCGQTWDHQWDQFLTWYYMAVHKNERLAQAPEPSMLLLYNLAVHTLEKMEKHWSQMHLDGTLNVWIVKPGANSRGRGIQLMNRMEKVLAKVNPAFVKETRYVVQKYIERPLLIYNTKFDIRQWFLVTCVQPMTIWMYRESYLRFCSQCFDLLNFHESVHLCNNAVQRKYRNGARDPKLPDENMWDCYTFQAYLRTLGKAEMWSQRIYPGMCQGIVGALLASQENIDGKNNCFELFGADFILDEAFTPWLIEINSCPSMCESTSVTARMCPQCLEDVIKVVVDRRSNRKADTGMFELIFKQHLPPAPPYLGVSLSIRGQRVSKTDMAKIDEAVKKKSIKVEAILKSEDSFGPSATTDNIKKLEEIIKLEAPLSSLSTSFADKNKTPSGFTPLRLSPKHGLQSKFTLTTQRHADKITALTSTKGKSESKTSKDHEKPTHKVEEKLLFFPHNIKQMKLSQNSSHKVKLSNADNNGKTSPKANIKRKSLCSEQKPTIKNFNSIHTPTKLVNTKQLFSPKHVMPPACLKAEKSPIHVSKNKVSAKNTKNCKMNNTVKDRTKSNSPKHDLQSPEESLECIQTQTVNNAHESQEAKTNIPVQEVPENIASRSWSNMGKKKQSLSNMLEREDTADTMVPTLPAGQPQQAENTTAMQTKSHTHSIPKNTDDGDRERLWLHAEKKEEAQSREDIFKRKRLVSNPCMNDGDALRASEVYDQWRQKLAQTKASCEELMNTLKVFKDRGSLQRKPNMDINPTSMRMIHSFPKRYSTDQEPPAARANKLPFPTENLVSGWHYCRWSASASVRRKRRRDNS